MTDVSGVTKPAPSAFAREVDRRREIAGLSLTKLGEIIGVSRQRMATYARGWRGNPRGGIDPVNYPAEHIPAIADALGWDVDEAMALAGYRALTDADLEAHRAAVRTVLDLHPVRDVAALAQVHLIAEGRTEDVREFLLILERLPVHARANLLAIARDVAAAVSRPTGAARYSEHVVDTPQGTAAEGDSKPR